jgi:uncharacterized protein (DUF1697 family)
MAQFAALLRGINVGGKKKIAMADLRALLTDLGYTDVRTLLQSGNAVFTARAGRHDKKIESAIADTFGMQVSCLIRTGDELRAVIEANPFPQFTDQGSRLMALFLSEQPSDAQLAENDPIALDPEQAVLGDRVIYQWCPNGVLEAPQVGQFTERKLKLTVTARNWNTLTKLAAMLETG